MENAINQKLWTIRDRETGVMIDHFSTEIEAKNALVKYENEDRHNGDYCPDFYEIVPIFFSNRNPESVYLEYVNDFISIEGMAEYYNINEHDLKNIIDEGREINHSKPQISMELQALQNAVIYTGITRLTIHEKQQQDKRKTVSKYFLNFDGATISPVLDYTNMNHFLLGLKKAKELKTK